MASPSTAHVLDVVGALYDAGLGTGSWQDALARLAALFGTGHANLAIQCTEPAEASGVIAVGVDDATVDSYVGYYANLNPLLPALPRMPVGVPVTDAMVAPRNMTVRSEFYNDWARPNGLDEGLFAVLVRRGTVNACACICRSPGDGGFEQSHIDLFRLLMPHLQRALQVHVKLAEARIERADAVFALDRLRLGVLLVTKDGAVCHANQEAEAILRESDGLRIDHGKLAASMPRATTVLRQTLSATIAGSSDPLIRGPSRSDGVLRIERPSARRPLALLIVPTPRPSTVWPQGVPAARAAIFVTDPERRQAVLPDTLSQIYGLTPREASLAIRISQGLRLRDAAERLGIAEPTARTHLLRVFAKTDTQRQAELVQLLGRLAAVSQA